MGWVSPYHLEDVSLGHYRNYCVGPNWEKLLSKWVLDSPQHKDIHLRHTVLEHLQLHLSDLLFDLCSLQHREESCETQSIPCSSTINIGTPSYTELSGNGWAQTYRWMMSKDSKQCFLIALTVLLCHTYDDQSLQRWWKTCCLVVVTCDRNWF